LRFPSLDLVPKFVTRYRVYRMCTFFQALWPVLLPMIAVLPAGDSMAVDRRRGVDATIITRVGWTSYFGGKIVGNALVSVAAVALAMAVAVGAEALVYPLTLPRYLDNMLAPAPFHRI
ncbi:MAG: hypothetical protein ACYDAK_13540, partial [Candidatus Limnocylindrales bacterium]